MLGIDFETYLHYPASGSSPSLCANFFLFCPWLSSSTFLRLHVTGKRENEASFVKEKYLGHQDREDFSATTAMRPGGT